MKPTALESDTREQRSSTRHAPGCSSTVTPVCRRARWRWKPACRSPRCTTTSAPRGRWSLPSSSPENRRRLARQTQMYGQDVPLWRRYEQACDFLEDDLESGFVRVLQEMIAAGWSNPAIADAARDVLVGWYRLLTEVATEAAERLGGLGPFEPAEVATLIGNVFIGSEALLLLGFDRHRAAHPSRPASCRQLIRALMEGSSSPNGNGATLCAPSTRRHGSSERANGELIYGVSFGHDRAGRSVLLAHVVRSSPPGSGRPRCRTWPATTGSSPSTAGAPGCATARRGGGLRQRRVRRRPGRGDGRDRRPIGRPRRPVVRGDVGFHVRRRPPRPGHRSVRHGPPSRLDAAHPERHGRPSRRRRLTPPEAGPSTTGLLARRDYPDFLRFFFDQMFPEPHSTKQVEDCVGWGQETVRIARPLIDATPARGLRSRVLRRGPVRACPLPGARRPRRRRPDPPARQRRAPGRADRRRARHHRRRRATARTLATRCSSTASSRASSTAPPRPGDRAPGRRPAAAPSARCTCPRRSASATPDATSPSPTSCASRTPTSRSTGWPSTRSPRCSSIAASTSIPPRACWPASRPTSSTSAPSTTSTPSRRSAGWTRSSSATSWCSTTWSTAEHYDLVIGDEAWDVDHFLHENPELKRFAFAWMTDFVGWLPMPDGGDAEAALTADHNRR